MKNNYQTVLIYKVEKESLKMKNFILDISLKAKPGQYVMVWLPRINEKPFAIAANNPLMLSVAKVGPFTELIHKLKAGDKLTFRGPYGTFFSGKGRKVLLVGGGYGIVPLYFLAQSFNKVKRKNTTIIIGAKTKNDLSFVNKFKNIGCTVEISTDDDSLGFKGLSTDLLQKLLNQEKYDGVYVCGPMVMMKKIARLCYEKKIYCEVSLESLFKCGGMGLCGECSFKGRFICKEGTVFPGNFLLEE